MNTLGGKTSKIISKEESYSINNGFLCTEKVSAGTIVKLNSDGTVSPVELPADVPFGILSSGCREANGEVTVQTPFNAVVRGKASGSITVGLDLSVVDTVTDNGNTLSVYKDSVSAGGVLIVAQALSNAADGEDVWVVVYRVFLPVID